MTMFGDLFSQHADYQKGILYQGRRRFLVPKGKNALEPPVQFMTRRQSQRSLQNARARADKLQPISSLDIAPQHLHNVIMNTKNSFLSLRNNNDFRSKRNIKSGNNKNVIINHFSSVDSRDWEEQYQAGCHLYVNKHTGEVSVECPWKPTLHQAYKSKQLQETTRSLSIDEMGSPSNKGIRLEPLAASPRAPALAKTASPLAMSSPGNVFVSSGSSVVSLGSLGISSGRYRVYDEDENLGTGSLVYDHNELDDMFQLLDSVSVKDEKKEHKHGHKST